MTKTNVQVLGFDSCENLGCGFQGPERLHITQKAITEILANLLLKYIYIYIYMRPHRRLEYNNY
jgi:hypothetical protein